MKKPKQIKILPLVFHRTDTGTEPVRDWLKGLSKTDRRRLGVGLKELEIGWPIGMPLCKTLGGGLFELRVSLDRRIARVILSVHENQLVALHGFIKKSRKIPDVDLTLARKRKKDAEKK